MEIRLKGDILEKGMTEDKEEYCKANCKHDRVWTKTVAVLTNVPKASLWSFNPLFKNDFLISNVAFKAFHNLVPIFFVIPMCPYVNPEFQQYWLAISPKYIKFSAYILFLLLRIPLVLPRAQLNYHLLIYFSLTFIAFYSYSRYLLHVLYPCLH